MLKQEHYLYDEIYHIRTVVGVVEPNDIEKYLYLGRTKDNKNNNYIIAELRDDYSSDYYLLDDNHTIFDTKAEAEQYIGFYNNGKDFIDIR